MKLLLAYIFAFVFTGNSFERDVNTYLQKFLNDYDKYEYSIDENLSKYKSIEINYTRSSNRIGNNFFLPVKLVDRFDIEREKFLTIDLKIYEKVLVAVGRIAKGDELNQSNTEWKLTDVTNLTQKPISNENHSQGIIAKFTLQPGEIICYDYVENSPVLEVGDQVNLYYGFGSVVINFSGVTRQSGAVGEIIKVRSNGRQYSAKIINSSEALIIE